MLAAAGLKRLGLSSRIRTIFEPEDSLPAAGQGALGIEVRTGRPALVAALAPLVHMPTWLCVAAEREVSRALGGSCSVPLAAHGRWQSGQVLRLEAAWGEPEGASALLRAQDERAVTSLAEAVALGRDVAGRLIAAGARVAPPVV